MLFLLTHCFYLSTFCCCNNVNFPTMRPVKRILLTAEFSLTNQFVSSTTEGGNCWSLPPAEGDKHGRHVETAAAARWNWEVWTSQGASSQTYDTDLGLLPRTTVYQANMDPAATPTGGAAETWALPRVSHQWSAGWTQPPSFAWPLWSDISFDLLTGWPLSDRHTVTLAVTDCFSKMVQFPQPRRRWSRCCSACSTSWKWDTCLLSSERHFVGSGEPPLILPSSGHRTGHAHAPGVGSDSSLPLLLGAWVEVPHNSAPSFCSQPVKERHLSRQHVPLPNPNHALDLDVDGFHLTELGLGCWFGSMAG